MAIFRIYVDGSCTKNPGGAVGFAAIILDETGALQEVDGAGPTGTNNSAELEAVILGLSALPDDAEGVLYSDSAYVVNAVNDWLPGSVACGFRNTRGKPIKNIEAFKRLVAQIARLGGRVILNHARGNSCPWMKRADMLARMKAFESQFEPS
jgi:ribonuclease HI